MVRPLVDFVHVARLEPRTVVPPGAGAPLRLRTLSIDPDGGGRSLVADVPAGWRLPAGRWDTDLEVFVLSGTLRAGDALLERYAYTFVPAGLALPGLHTATGARVLLFTAARPGFLPGAGSAPDCRPERAVAPVHLADVPWERPRVADFPAGAGRKTLRLDDETQQGFWVLGALAHWNSPHREWHTFAEENYLLEGEIETSVGLMTPDTYLAHPPGPEFTHGPMRSRTGMLIITRACGAFANTYEPTDAVLTGAWR